MNIYGSLMDIFDEKKQKSFMTKKTKVIYDEKNKRHLCRKKTKTQTKMAICSYNK